MSKKEMKKVEKTEKVTVPVEMFACLDDQGENYLVDIELPGVNKKDIELSMHEDLVLVRAQRPNQTLMGHLHFPLKVNQKRAQAKFNQGLLSVVVPVKEKRTPPVSVKIK